SSEFGAPNAYEPGFDLADVEAGRYGQRLHFWNLERHELEQTIDLGPNGLVPLEIRWQHNPASDQGFVGAALSSTIWRFHRQHGTMSVDPDFHLDFHNRPDGPARAHEVRLQGGDSTSEVFP